MQNRRRSIAQPLPHILSWDLTRSTASVSHCSVFWIACWITLAFSFTFARRILGKTNKWLQSEPSIKIYGSGCSSLYWVWHIFVSVDIGYHNRWNRQVGVRHPNLWVFIRKLKRRTTSLSTCTSGSRPWRRSARKQAVLPSAAAAHYTSAWRLLRWTSNNRQLLESCCACHTQFLVTWKTQLKW